MCAITRPDWPGRERAMTEEEVDKFVEAITSRGGSEIHEAGWDASKHPRRGGPPNAGWWASTAGGGGGAGSTTPNSPVDRQYRRPLREANRPTPTMVPLKIACSRQSAPAELTAIKTTEGYTRQPLSSHRRKERKLS